MAVNISKFDDRLCGSAYGVGRDAGAWRGQGRRYGVGRGAGINPGVWPAGGVAVGCGRGACRPRPRSASHPPVVLGITGRGAGVGRGLGVTAGLVPVGSLNAYTLLSAAK